MVNLITESVTYHIFSAELHESVVDARLYDYEVLIVGRSPLLLFQPLLVPRPEIELKADGKLSHHVDSTSFEDEMALSIRPTTA